MTRTAGRQGVTVRRVAATLALAWAGEARAEGAPSLTPFADVRLRQEWADVEPGREASALTVRVRGGVELEAGEATSVLLELEAVGEIAEDESAPGLRRQLIPDRNLIDLNRAQLTRRFAQGRAVLGRQRIEIDDERFVGAAAFRQNDQTLDAVRLVATTGPATFDLAYVWQVNRAGAPQTVKPRFESDSWLAHVSTATPVGRLSAYHYALDLAEEGPGVSDHRNASQTTGVSLQGRAARRAASLAWRLEYAWQSDYAANPIDYEAEYLRARLTGDVEWGALTAGVERLGSGGARAFQTPLGSNHGFQGSADLFLVTPPAGVEDVFVEAVLRRAALGPVRNVALSVRRHRFRNGDGDARLGDEWDLALSGGWRGYRLSLEHADYRARGFGADTRRTWLTVARSF